jgi:hypothetical protein
MARFTHLAHESDEKAIVRSGIKPSPYDGDALGVHAMPVLPDFFASHQWLRELRRRSPVPLVAIDFVIADDEEVRVGHYSAPHTPMTAAEASGVILGAEDARGYEVVILRKIEPTEIRRSRRVPQVVGWRYWPDAHGKRPCSCDVCQRGTYKATGLRRSP